MDYAKLRKTNLIWALISVIILVLVCMIIGFAFKEDRVLLWDFLICGIGGFGIFWCMYLLRFSSRKTNYPFVLSEAHDYHGRGLRFIYDNEFIWTLIFPSCAAILMPGAYLAIGLGYTTTFADQENVKLWIRLVIIILVTLGEICNNVIYIQVVKQISSIKSEEFTIRN